MTTDQGIAWQQQTVGKLDVDPRKDNDATPMSSYRFLLREEAGSMDWKLGFIMIMILRVS